MTDPQPIAHDAVDDVNHPPEPQAPRRGFLTRLFALGAGAAGMAAAFPGSGGGAGIGGLAGRGMAGGIPGDRVRGNHAADPWTRRLSGTHRVLIHSHQPTGGVALRWASTFLDTQSAAYGLRDAESSVVVGLNGTSIGLVFNDYLWANYPIGETLGMPGTTNPAGPSGTSAIAKMVDRGVILLVCNNSMRAAGQRFLPEAARSDPAARTAFYELAKSNLLPGVELVPAMIVTLQQAQDLGCRYIYAGG